MNGPFSAEELDSDVQTGPQDRVSVFREPNWHTPQVSSGFLSLQAAPAPATCQVIPIWSSQLLPGACPGNPFSPSTPKQVSGLVHRGGAETPCSVMDSLSHVLPSVAPFQGDKVHSGITPGTGQQPALSPELQSWENVPELVGGSLKSQGRRLPDKGVPGQPPKPPP